MNEKLILSILDRFSAGQMAELLLDDGDLHLCLRKENAIRAAAAGSALLAPVAAQSVPALSVSDSVEAKAAIYAKPVAVQQGLPVDTAEDTIKSPLVGVFYAAAGPEEPPFVTVGSRVKKGESLCILEAMKMMNRLEAEFDCEILKVLVSSGEGVEYEQPLFTVKRL
ncbi:MAG: acetyl-CoA carboxylase biotin carboxyl carrier protein [Spirochaetaceae bacterium]|jgi:acetyl-CoA carboxylase biotin carboxyl carrier protein|nr:acetyl-CoA carboxylase biotin carboxyl carrier protein [Spirochaetaceae bacterium]